MAVDVSIRKDVDLHAVLVGALQALAGEARRQRAELILQAQALHCTVPGNRHELQQMVLNLLLDAMAAMDDTHFAWRRVLVSTRDCEDDGSIALVIKDRGQPLKAPRLAAARTITQAHGGQFEVAARPGGGNVCTVTLPCRPRHAGVLPVLAVGPAATPRQPRWVVLA
jgi:signal transduction histidine kinase